MKKTRDNAAEKSPKRPVRVLGTEDLKQIRGGARRGIDVETIKKVTKKKAT